MNNEQVSPESDEENQNTGKVFERLDLEKLEEKEVVLRTAEREDYQGLLNAIQDRWDYRHKKYGLPKRDITKDSHGPEFLEELEKSISNPDELEIFLVTVDGEVAGYVEFGKDKSLEPNAIRLNTLSVLEKYHGKEIGKKLLEYAEDNARTNFGAEKMCLRVHSWNKPARALYRKAGYKQAGKPYLKEGEKVLNKPVYMVPLVKDFEPKNK